MKPIAARAWSKCVSPGYCNLAAPGPRQPPVCAQDTRLLVLLLVPRPQIPPSMQMTLMETRRLPQACSIQDLLEKWLTEVSHHYLRAPSRVLLPLQPPQALLEHQVPGSPMVLLWLKSHGESPTVLGLALCPRVPALLMLQPKGFCQGMQEGLYMSLLSWRQYIEKAQAHHLAGIRLGLMMRGQDGCWGCSALSPGLCWCGAASVNQQHPLNHFLTGSPWGSGGGNASAMPQPNLSTLPGSLSSDPCQPQGYFPAPAPWDTRISPGVGIPELLSWIRVEQQTRHSSCSCKASCDA